MTAVTVRTRVDASEIDWQGPITVSIAAIVALVATVPLVAMIASPLETLVSQAVGPQRNPLGLAAIMIAPLGYCLFAATAWASMKDRAEPKLFAQTMRTAAYGLVPYVVLSLVGIGWVAGPRLPLVMAAALSVPAGAVATIWASARVR